MIFAITGRAAVLGRQPTSKTSDESLVQRIASGDRVAMRALFVRHQLRLYRFLARLVRDEALAEDLVSDVFLDVWRQAASFEARSSVSTWLLAMGRYKGPLGAAPPERRGWCAKSSLRKIVSSARPKSS
jgi:hypothetical protein